ncbi:MAG TPA: glycosyltransferase family 1 protein [Chitinophagaceae bacterium]|nr:glycosyltransferase family 1 protein [Chitinophagaceae bacterium]
MKIAVDTRSLGARQPGGCALFLEEVLKRLTRLRPSDEFIFVSDKTTPEAAINEPNVIAIRTGPGGRHRLALKWWLDISLPSLLKKHAVDVFVSGEKACSLKTSIPQCLLLHDLSHTCMPSMLTKAELGFYKKFMSRFVEKAARIITISEFSRREISTQYPLAHDKIDVVYKGVKEIFHPLAPEETYLLRDQYTNGKNYFIYVGPVHARKNLQNLLKAFSIFKKRQKSDWKLMLTGRRQDDNESFTKSLPSYKYRDDLVLTGYVEERLLARLIGSAYALVQPSRCEGFGVAVLEAMRCKVPVVTGRDSAMEEMTGDAAMISDTLSHEDMADKMMMLYKDESLRDRLIEKGRSISEGYDWERTAGLVWDSIEKAAASKVKR